MIPHEVRKAEKVTNTAKVVRKADWSLYLNKGPMETLTLNIQQMYMDLVNSATTFFQSSKLAVFKVDSTL